MMNRNRFSVIIVIGSVSMISIGCISVLSRLIIVVVIRVELKLGICMLG